MTISLIPPPRCEQCEFWKRHAPERLPNAEWSRWGDCQNGDFNTQVHIYDRGDLAIREDFGCVHFHPRPEVRYLFP